MQTRVKEAIQELEESIVMKQALIELIKNIDWEKPVNEKTWHAICETSLRTSDLLGVLVKNTFPDAEEIDVGYNYVFFDLYGFKCALPTSRCAGVYIDTEWYQQDNGRPEVHETVHEHNMTKYFEAKKNREKWETLFDYRFSWYKNHPKWIKAILWFVCYKWKDDEQETWERKREENLAAFEKRVNKYNQERKEMHEKRRLWLKM